MGKNKPGQASFGRALIKDRFRGRKAPVKDSGIHTSELNDGYDWNRINLRSVTEEQPLEEFLGTASIAGAEFAAEKQNIQFVSFTAKPLPTDDERKRLDELHLENKKFLSIPRRPAWDDTTTREELESNERESFLEWRRELAKLQENDEIVLTPFEKNLELWKQLWRVIEKSDVVVQIVDARNPLLFRCEDLENYVKEVDESKINLLLINKSDLLTEDQRSLWASYFCSANLRAIFFSALAETEKKDDEPVEKDDDDEEDKETSGETESSTPEDDSSEQVELPDLDDIFSLGLLLNREQLIALFKIICKNKEETVKEGVATIGLVGYPNVGKSSTINSIMTSKKVAVSATPGKTKHFQTLFVDEELMLCDCPGLVFPNIVATKADMFVSGILPIDEMRNHVPPIALVTSYFPRRFLEQHYSILLPHSTEGKDEAPSVEEFLISYGYMRGFMTQRGLPDQPRSARYILKDLVRGKLLYCHSPPGGDQNTYQKFVIASYSSKMMTPNQARMYDLKEAPKIDEFGMGDVGLADNEEMLKAVRDMNVSKAHCLSRKNFKGRPGEAKAGKAQKRVKARKAYAHLDE